MPAVSSPAVISHDCGNRLFGKENTEYDFAKEDVPECKKRAKQLEERHKILERSLDRHVMDKFAR